MEALIVGTGFTGSLAVAALAESSIELTCLVRPQRQHQLVRHLEVSSPFGRFRKPVHTISPNDEVPGSFDVVFLANRADQVAEALAVADKFISADTWIVPLFEGVSHIEYLRTRYPENVLFGVVAETCGYQDADGATRQWQPHGEWHVGLLSNHSSEHVERLLEMLNGRRFSVHQCEGIVAAMWARHVFMSAAIGAAQFAGRTLKDTLRFSGRAFFKGMLNSGGVIANRKGIGGVGQMANAYAQAFEMHGVPVQGPNLIGGGGRAGRESRYLLEFMHRSALETGVHSSGFDAAWSCVDKPDNRPAARHVAKPVKASVDLNAPDDHLLDLQF